MSTYLGTSYLVAQRRYTNSLIRSKNFQGATAEGAKAPSLMDILAQDGRVKDYITASNELRNPRPHRHAYPKG